MAQEAVATFYAFLEKTPAVKQEALTIKDRFEEQEEQINELIRLAEQHGFSFSFQEFIQFLYQRSV